MCFESNLAFEAQHLVHALTEANVKRWICLHEGQAGTLGWLTVCLLLSLHEDVSYTLALLFTDQ